MPAHFQQHDVVQLVAALVAGLPQIGELAGVGFVGQEAAAAGGLGVVLQAETARQLDLRLAVAAGEIVQPRAVHPALALGQSLGQVERAERAQQAVVGAGLAADDGHGFLALALGPLAHHLAGDDEIEALLAGQLTGLVQHQGGLVDHEDLAVQAGVQMGAVAVLGVEHHILVLLGDINDVQLDAQLLGHPEGVVALVLVLVFLADRVGVALHAEAGEEVHPFHVNALLLHHFYRQHGVQPAGHQRDGAALERVGAGPGDGCDCLGHNNTRPVLKEMVGNGRQSIANHALLTKRRGQGASGASGRRATANSRLASVSRRATGSSFQSRPSR